MSNQHTKFSSLSLVFPPISDRDLSNFQNETTPEDHIKQSSIYMITKKIRGDFENISIEEINIKIEIHQNNEVVSCGFIIADKFLEAMGRDVTSFCLATGKASLQFKDSETGLLIERITPNDILWRRSIGVDWLVGFDNFSDLLQFHVLYIGISKANDSFTRLVKNPHKKRIDILSQERQLTRELSTSDELFTLFFRVDSHFISGTEDATKFPEISKSMIVSDAEKAFVHILKPTYNTIKFKSYPKGKDGLSSANINSYSYTISENITIKTKNAFLSGEKESNGDYILIEDNIASIVNITNRCT